MLLFIKLMPARTESGGAQRSLKLEKNIFITTILMLVGYTVTFCKFNIKRIIIWNSSTNIFIAVPITICTIVYSGVDNCKSGFELPYFVSMFILFSNRYYSLSVSNAVILKLTWKLFISVLSIHWCTRWGTLILEKTWKQFSRTCR